MKERLPFGFPAWSIAAATGLTFFAGAATAWVFFELDWTYELGVAKGSGSVADWWAAIAGGFAAIGTWAIGAGALYVAYRAHILSVASEILKRNQVRAAQLREDAVEKSLLWIALTAGTGAHRVKSLIGGFLAVPHGQRTWGDLRDLLENLHLSCAPIDLDKEVLARVPSQAIQTLKFLNSNLAMARTVVTRLADAAADKLPEELLGASEIGELQKLSRSATMVDALVRAFAKTIRDALGME